MAEKVNQIHDIINNLLRETPNSENIAFRFAEKHYWIEVQLSRDYELVKDSILSELRATNEQNIELQKVKIEAILLVVLKQFEERKINALRNVMYTKERANQRS